MEFRHEQMRRKNDPNGKRERRKTTSPIYSWRVPKWVELKLQFQTRYLLTLIGVVLFNWVYQSEPSFVSLLQMNLFFALYFIWITATYFLIYHDQHRVWKARLTMWIDILGIAFVVLNDPSYIPSTALVWVLIVMGNGMRFGMRFFRESLFGCLLVGAVVLYIKASGASYETILGITIEAMFGAMVIVYSYVLTSRIDRSHREIEQTSRTDSLTTLLNRLSFVDIAEDLLQTACKDECKLSVMFIDIDKFKSINDSLGHIQGDRVLSKLSSILKGNIRADDVAARYGGDEFVLILRDSSIESATEIASRIHEETRDWVEKCDFDLSLSIGIGEAPTHGKSLDELLHKVDQAMYSAKFSKDCGGVTCAAV